VLPPRVTAKGRMPPSMQATHHPWFAYGAPSSSVILQRCLPLHARCCGTSTVDKRRPGAQQRDHWHAGSRSGMVTAVVATRPPPLPLPTMVAGTRTYWYRAWAHNTGAQWARMARFEQTGPSFQASDTKTNEQQAPQHRGLLRCTTTCAAQLAPPSRPPPCHRRRACRRSRRTVVAVTRRRRRQRQRRWQVRQRQGASISGRR